VSDGPPRFEGEAGRPGGPAGRAAIVLDDGSFSFTLAGEPPRRAAYRDLSAVAVTEQAGLIVIGSGDSAERLLLSRFGPALGPLVRELRDRRLRQRMLDRFVQLPDSRRIDLVEWTDATTGAAAVAQWAVHDRGLVLAPVDEGIPWRVVNRGDIGPVTSMPQVGGLRIDLVDGTAPITLARLGTSLTSVERQVTAIRDQAYVDATSLIEALVPDLPFRARDGASRVLVDGRPAGPETLGDAWRSLETAVCAQPPFDESYRVLIDRGGGGAALRWVAIAPDEPAADALKAWFLVALPGNVVALELVSEGAHATYCFRVVPRREYGGAAPGDMAGAVAVAVAGISRALVDARFLREPIALPEARLARPEYLRYRLALGALPSLAAARAMFIARLVHTDAATWTAALDDLVRWHARERDDGAVWPGRAAQEAAVDGAVESDAPAGTPGTRSGTPG
jgi:hypothetical protein